MKISTFSKSLRHLIIEISTNCQLKFLVTANSFFFDLTVQIVAAVFQFNHIMQIFAINLFIITIL
jgi:hypothetical protein